MPKVWIPASLRSLSNQQESVTVGGRTLREVIDELDQRFPGIKDRLRDANGLRPGIAVAIDQQFAGLGLLQPIREDSEIHFLPAISGGERRGVSPPVPHRTAGLTPCPSRL